MQDSWTHKFTSTKDTGRGMIDVEAGLHKLGNQSPYFSVTATGWRNKTRCDSSWSFGGCCHDLILEHWPELAPVIALHLHDVDGIPMHAEDNGWYWLAGALGGMGEQYHGGNGTGKTPDQCLQVFADHCLISVERAREIAEDVNSRRSPRWRWRGIMDELKPMWKQRADEAIALLDRLIAAK
jgi:hypothetical protein